MKILWIVPCPSLFGGKLLTSIVMLPDKNLRDYMNLQPNIGDKYLCWIRCPITSEVYHYLINKTHIWLRIPFNLMTVNTHIYTWKHYYAYQYSMPQFPLKVSRPSQSIRPEMSQLPTYVNWHNAAGMVDNVTLSNWW